MTPEDNQTSFGGSLAPPHLMTDLRDVSRPSRTTPPFERLLYDLEAAFVTPPPQEIDSVIQACLGRLVAGLGVERCTLIEVLPSRGRLAVTHSVSVPGVDPVPTSLALGEATPWALGMAMANRPIVFARLDDLPSEAGVDKEVLRSIGLKSHVTMPIFVAGELLGALSFGCVREERNWSAGLLRRMRLVANVLGGAVARKRTQALLDSAIEFERLASTILASLVLAGPDHSEIAISEGLCQIGQFMGAERTALWYRTPGTALFCLFRSTQRWHAEGHAFAIGDAPALPWIMQRLARGHIVRLPRLGDLPSDAEADRIALQAAGVRSVLVVPISVSGKVAGALSIASTQHEHEWPEALMPGVSLLAKVFGALHARETADHRKIAAEAEAAHWRERLAHVVRVHTAGEMSVALAHEITQPLGAIENYALAARRHMTEPAPDMVRLADLVDKVIGQATRAGDVVTRMRSMVRHHTLDAKLIEIEQAICNCISMVRIDCELRDIEVRLSAQSALPLVKVDEVHLQQVVLNLLRNAMEAIDQCGGERVISVSIALNPREEIQVELADTGGGIAEGDLERVFESFYSTKANGLGVGLAICRKLIEAHGGMLWALHNPAGGALFRFTIPVSTEEG